MRRPEKQLGPGPLQLAPTKHSDRRCGVWWLGSSATFLLVLGGVLHVPIGSWRAQQADGELRAAIKATQRDASQFVSWEGRIQLAIRTAVA